MTAGRFFAWASSAMVAVGVILSFAFIGTPSHARAIALDRRRVSDLETIADHLEQERGDLPSRLPEILSKADPATHQVYYYKRLGVNRYELCADFAAHSEAGEEDENWSHPAGRHCFSLRRPK